MRAVHQWVLTKGSHLLFLYGQVDPWSATPFTLGSHPRGSVIYTIAGGNHVTPYTGLPAAQETSFVNALRAWAGLAPEAAGQIPASGPAPAFVTELAARN